MKSGFVFLVDGVVDYAIFLLDPDGNVLTWNTDAQRIKGYQPHEIIGEHFSRFYPPEALARGLPDHEPVTARADGRFEDEGWRLRKDGSRFWGNVTFTALFDTDRKLSGFAKVTRDLTQRKAHEDALRQSEERFRLLVDGVTNKAIFKMSAQ